MAEIDVSCIFCLKSVNSGENISKEVKTAESGNANKITGKFFKLLQRHLNSEIINVNVNKDESLTSLLFKSFDASEKVPFGINSCGDCSQLMSHFLDLYEQLKVIELKANWALCMIANVMSTATKIDARVKRFNDSVRTKTPKNVSLDRIRFKGIYDFRRDLIKKCYDRYNLQLPKVSLKRKNVIKTEIVQSKKHVTSPLSTTSTQNRVLRPRVNIRAIAKKRIHWKVKPKPQVDPGVKVPELKSLPIAPDSNKVSIPERRDAPAEMETKPSIVNLEQNSLESQKDALEIKAPMVTLEQNNLESKKDALEIKPSTVNLEKTTDLEIKPSVVFSESNQNPESPVADATDLDVKPEVTPPVSEPKNDTHLNGPTELIKSELDLTLSDVQQEDKPVKRARKRTHWKKKIPQPNSHSTFNKFDIHKSADTNINLSPGHKQLDKSLEMNVPLTPPAVKLHNGTDHSNSTGEPNMLIECSNNNSDKNNIDFKTDNTLFTLMGLTADTDHSFSSSPYPWARDPQLVSLSNNESAVSSPDTQVFTDLDAAGRGSDEDTNSDQEFGQETDDEIIQKYTLNGGEYNGNYVYVVTPSIPPGGDQRKIQLLSRRLTPSQLHLAAACLHPPKYECPTDGCKQQFVFEHHLQSHLKLHGEFPCQLCPHVESYAPNLAHHVYAEHCLKSDDEVTCAICPPKSFASEHHIFHFLEEHLQLDVTSLGCLICHEISKGRGLTHFRKCHHVWGKKTSKVHQCGQCLAFFVDKSKLDAHGLSVHNTIQ